MVERKVFKRKLCMLYQRGHCSRQRCSFAHGNSELRHFSGSYNGKRNYRDGDLRDKLDRRLSPGRDARDRQMLRGYSPSRSTGRNSDRNRKKKQRFDGQSDFSENLKFPNEIEDFVKEGRKLTASSTSKSILEDQLKEVQLDINTLTHQKHELEIFGEEKTQEVGSLTSQIEELNSQLEKERDECKRITSRIKKFVKTQKCYSHLEDELKRSQAQLQKLGEQLGLNISGTSGNEENSNINIVSDCETTGVHMSLTQNNARSNSSQSKKRLYANQDITEGRISDGKERLAETSRSGKRSRWSEHPSQYNADKENVSLKNGNSSIVPLGSNEKLREGIKVSVITSTAADKLKGAHTGLSLPSTSMAANAVNDDEEFEIEEEEKVEVRGLPFVLPLPPPILPNGYSQYQDNDQNVDVDGLDEENVHVEII